MFKIRFMLQTPQDTSDDDVTHEIGFCELNLSEVSAAMALDDDETRVESRDVYDSTDTVVGFVELEVTSFYAKVTVQ